VGIKGDNAKKMIIVPDEKIVTELRDWFINYVNTFNDDSKELRQNIGIKREHTEKVIEEITNIGRELGLNDNELNLAEIIALFHDIGRFEQYNHYKTFSDQKSENHAELGIKILKEHNVLGGLDAGVQQLILCSIRYHNRPSLPINETDSCLFYSRLIRDADKLDIWRVVTDYYHRVNGRRNVALELELPDTHGFSKEVYDSLMKKQVVCMKYVKNINDIKLLQVGWIFDLNFKPAFERVKERRYLEMIRDVLPDSKEINGIFDVVNAYVTECNK